ncbi:MAG: cation:proton antiporter, partial [Pedobacter sp.]
LVDFGVMLKSKHTLTSIYGLNVIDDELSGTSSAAASKKILNKAISHAAASENNIIPVTRYDSSISNGIVYTIKEHGITDVVIGLHQQADQHTYLGAKAENIIKRVNETIYIYKPMQPFNTFTRIVVAMPPNSETEPGFLHWLKKMLQIAKEAGIPIHFYSTPDAKTAIEKVVERSAETIQMQFKEFSNWDDFLIFSRDLKVNDLFVIVSSRKGHDSYLPQLNKLPYYLSNYFLNQSLIMLYPMQLDSGINMGDIEQADSNLIETISDQIDAIGKAGKYVRGLFKGK